MKKQSSGVLLKNSAEIVGFLGGLCCPSKRRQLPHHGREAGPSKEGQVGLSQSFRGSPWQVWLLELKMRKKNGLFKKSPKG